MDTNNYDALVHAPSTMSNVPPHVSGIPQQSIWEKHKSIFIQLYVEEKKTLREVKTIVEKDFAFPRTPLSTYESKFRNELGLKKKLKSSDWIAIHDHISHLGNLKVDVLLNGHLIPPTKVKKEINRNLKRRSGTTGALSLPEGVEIRPVSQEITMHDRQIVAVNSAVPHPLHNRSCIDHEPSSTDIRPASRFPFSHKIASDQHGICSAFDPLLVDDYFGSSEMPMEPAESLFLSTAEEATHITSRLPGSFQKMYDMLTLRLTRNRSVTGILVLDPEFQKIWSSMLGHLPIMQSLVDPATRHPPQSQVSDHSWPSDEDFFINIEDAPQLHYLSSVEHCHQRLIWSVQEIDQVTAPPIDAPLSTSRDIFQVINSVLYLLSNNPKWDEALEYVRQLVAQNMSWSTVEAILKIPSRTIQSTWVFLADCAFKLYVRRLFDAVVSPASDHKEWLVQHGPKWLAQAAVLGSTVLCRKLMEFGISPNSTVDRGLAIFGQPDRRQYRDDIGPWATTGLKIQPSWCRQYHSHMTYGPFQNSIYIEESELYTSPLVEAAVRGHVEIVDGLVEGGANFEQRINGCTTIGHLLHSLFHNNLNLEDRLQILQRLLEFGAKVDVPFHDAPGSSRFPGASQDTIADMVWLTNCQEAIHMVRNYAKACFGRLTVQGVLRAAGNSFEELADLLQSFQAPTSVERLSVERTALMKAIDKPEILLNMIKAGFDLHEPRELVYINFGYDGFECAHTESFVPRNIILEKYLALIEEQPFHPFARQILQSIPHQVWPITPLTSVILGVCRTSDSLNLLLRTGVQLQKPFLISAFAKAARDDDSDVMTLLLGLLGDINYSLRTGPIHWNILILAAMSKPFEYESSGLDLGYYPASIETLDWLIAHGADIPSCIRTLSSVQDLRMSMTFDTQRLEWLLAHNIRPPGKSLCGIFMECISLHPGNVFPPELTTSLFEPPWITDLPLFEPCTAMIDQNGQSVIKDFALVYFIKVGAPTEFLQHLCDSGISCNTPAKYCDSKRNPLSWQFFECDHNYPCECLTPLLAAISANRIDVVRYFVEKGADTNGGAHYNALEIACLLDIYFRGDLEAVLSTKIEIVKYLLRNGADPGRTKANNHLPTLRLTIKNFWDDPVYDIGDRQLFIKQHLQLLEVLLDASMGIQDFDTILTDALRDVLDFVEDGESQKVVTQLLLKYKTDIDERIWCRTPHGGLLMEACSKSDIDKIKYLLDQGVNPNWFKFQQVENGIDYGSFGYRGREPSPSTPSAVLAAQGNIPLLLLLRAAGAGLERYDNSLECAASAGRLDTVAWLLQFEKREEAFARAMMRAHLKKYTAIQTLIEEYLRSIGSDLLEDGNWKHSLYYLQGDRCSSRIRDGNFEPHPDEGW